MGCGQELAPGQWFNYCGETDMGQSLPALCVECGGKFKLMGKLLTSEHQKKTECLNQLHNTHPAVKDIIIKK